MNERIKLNDTLPDIVAKLSEGNRGAMSICMMIYKHGGEVDPQDVFAGLSGLLALDTMNIYGPKIYLFYADLCGRSLPKMLAVTRAIQLGYLREDVLLRALQEPVDTTLFDLDFICAEVAAFLVKFKLDWKPA